MSNTPPRLPAPTARMAARIDLVGGDVNTAPATAALNPPWPINESGVK
jgi:hypothetical protein